ncbi:hypothetical protein [Streptomyces griseorubiginosus]|uniref:hypothetical protein n=1 Tax=Streptomyces griseorubiginosus TaxID=67304 RepID=UPI00332B824C
MTDLFRFVALRAPERTAPAHSIDLQSSSAFQKALASARQSESPVDAARQVAGRYLVGDYGPGFIKESDAIPDQGAYDKLAATAATALHAADLSAVIKSGFGKTPQVLAADANFKLFVQNVHDTIIALFLLPATRSHPISDLARLTRLTGLITRVAAADASLEGAGEIQRSLSESLVLPTTVFPLRGGLPQPVGVGDLLVVKQRLTRYEPGDVADIENILKGEKREKLTHHNLTIDTTVVTETSKTTETTTSLDVTERFDFKNEVQNTVSEDLSITGGVNVSAKYGAVETNANAGVAYRLSKEESAKVATDHARDVTNRAATKVTETVRRQETTRTIEVLKDRELHSFENTGPGNANVSGVYQWMNKVYEAQTFNYGSRLMFDLTVPEPAAFVVDATTVKGVQAAITPPEPFVVVNDGTATPHWRPVQPGDLGPDGLLKSGVVSRPITPADVSFEPLSATYYGTFMGKYGALGVNAPPEPFTTVTKSLTGNKDDHDHLAVVDDLTIPQGYQATAITAQGAFTLYEEEDGDERMWVFVGKHRFECKGAGTLPPNAALLPDPDTTVINEQGSMPIAVETQQARDFAVTVEVTCARTDTAVEQWRLDTYNALVNAHENLVSGYQDKVKAQAVQAAATVSLGRDPAQNRLIERAELKKACISLLSGTDLYDADIDDVTVNSTAPAFPRPNVPQRPNQNVVGSDQEAFIRFFEQAFEWEHMMYVFYPYYWARRETWYANALADDPDPLFAEFLKAGAARVVVPVRPQLEGDVRYFLMTGQIWNGGAVPGITDTDYLPITEEIRARDDAPGGEVPQGDPWEVTLPTTLVRLRADDTLPEWRKFQVNGQDVWVPGRIVAGKWTPDFGKLDSHGNWVPQ